MDEKEVNGSTAEEPSRPSAEQMDEVRYQHMAHEYLCRLREAREWIQACLDDKLPPLIEFEESLRNGVILARLANFVAPKVVNVKNIYDLDQSHYQDQGLHFRHTDNVSRFLKMAEVVGLPKIFYPEIVDIYDKKNMPKAIYCVHALSFYLRKRFGSKYPALTDVSSTARFTDEEISAMAKELAKYGVAIPAFGKIGGLLANEMPIDQVALHAAIIVINDTIDKGDANVTLQALQNPNAHMTSVNGENASYYQDALFAAKEAKRNLADVDSVEHSEDETELYSHFLTRAEIQNGIACSNGVALIEKINNALAACEGVRLLKLLRHPSLELESVVDEHPEYYLWLLQRALSDKGSHGDGKTPVTLDKEEIRRLILQSHMPLQKAIEKAKLVARINGLIESNADKNEILNTLHAFDDREQIDIIDVVIDLYTRNLAAAQSTKRAGENEDKSDWFAVATFDGCILYGNAKSGEVQFADPGGNTENTKYLNTGEIKEIIKTSNLEWGELSQQKEDNAAKKKQREEAARRIQAFYRKQKPQHDYYTLMRSPNPSLYIVQKFAGFLNETDIDYEEEMEVERFRKAIRDEIQQHKNYEKQLDELDLQIGLLVRNRINLEKTVKHTDERGRRQSGSSKRASVVEMNGDVRAFGFDLLTKSGRQLLHAYQNLLYLVTRNPKYLASILLSRSTDYDRFTDNIVMPLFNHGTGSYDEYLLLRFFKIAIESEVDQKVIDITQMHAIELVSAEQLVKFTVNSHGDMYKRDVLQQLLTGLLTISDPMDTNPVDVYRRWIVDAENRVGESSGLPLDVTPEQALVHPEVKAKVHESVVGLKRWVTDFLDAILGNLDKIPYCLRYSCKVFRSKLTGKFPQEELSAVSKSTADALFFRFIHSCITLKNDRGHLVNEDDERTKWQQMATANLAKLLRCIMIHKGYNEEYPHLVEFNDFIKDSHQRFKSFFNSLCDVPELEEFFDVDEYVDYVTPTKPPVILQMGDLIKLHKLLVDHRIEIADNLVDPLHELLSDLGGEWPSISDIVGDVDDGTRMRAESAEVVLTPTNKFEAPCDDNDEIRHEFLRTKKYLVDILLCQRASSVVELLDLRVSEADEMKHKEILDERCVSDQENEDRLSLIEKKRAVVVGLNTLEKAGLVSLGNDYREIITAIAKDIRTRRRYRENRTKERARLLGILEKLKQKSSSYREQKEFYDLYLKSCLNNMPAQTKKRDSAKRASTDKISLTVVKYSAAELVDKGVLLSLDRQSTPDITKSVQFEIKNTADPGVFEMSTKFLGAVDIQAEEILLQRLLQSRYEDIPVTAFFQGKVKMYVEPLIALLNKKFFIKNK